MSALRDDIRARPGRHHGSGTPRLRGHSWQRDLHDRVGGLLPSLCDARRTGRGYRPDDMPRVRAALGDALVYLGTSDDPPRGVQLALCAARSAATSAATTQLLLSDLRHRLSSQAQRCQVLLKRLPTTSVSATRRLMSRPVFGSASTTYRLNLAYVEKKVRAALVVG